MASTKKSYLFVAAIDFGTTYSGYAFSSKDEFDNDPLKIKSNVWNSGTLMSYKAPTALLLNPDKTFNSFGYEAETMMADEGGDLQDYFYFHRFKMVLHNNKNLQRATMIKDESGKPFPALDVFGLSIAFLKRHLVEAIKKQFDGIVDSDIKYVLTVPAIWDDNSKQFMREAARKGGIREEHLMIALEPEAASIYCQHVPVEKSTSSFLQCARSGLAYMVVDLGGGTADITVHQRQPDKTLKELHAATGGAFGGKSVDDAFGAFLEEIVGAENIQAMKEKHMDDYVHLLREFEMKKRKITEETPAKVTMTIPFALVELLQEDKMRKSIDDAVKKSRFSSTVTSGRQKIQIMNAEFRKFFRPTIDGIISHMEEILYDRRFMDVKYILMVGGFSDCILVQNAIRHRFTEKVVIVPDDAGLAVLKGAVLFGHVPRSISSRVARFTYGIQSWPVFEPRRHPADKKIMINGVARCRDGFFKYIEIGQQVTRGHSESQVFQALKPDEECLECSVYVSSKRDPDFVDEEGCRPLGVLKVPLDSNRRGPAEVEETLVFGETELHVRARDISTGKMYEASFDFLGDGI
ncbi:heat shock 70 kDa protein 12B-like [Mizuhopecten yessoensis]|uniref:Heat shock 70 kDa protein n=1 Tax=Mizuhopecten yessoensis TaxID=6573 RepID=A0A1C9U315_MIZYE|nr:heat shock 70 kDa protein 12B-like [Mizuhopecten yessoensis]AOR17373.1 heat shock 70 kDa protein [Mizuhopecten yessoensis]OWF39271.1 Heat shock 70 kDa protein 12B [Mizuhopecten yessoensis]